VSKKDEADQRTSACIDLTGDKPLAEELAKLFALGPASGPCAEEARDRLRALLGRLDERRAGIDRARNAMTEDWDWAGTIDRAGAFAAACDTLAVRFELLEEAVRLAEAALREADGASAQPTLEAVSRLDGILEAAERGAHAHLLLDWCNDADVRRRAACVALRLDFRPVHVGTQPRFRQLVSEILATLGPPPPDVDERLAAAPPPQAASPVARRADGDLLERAACENRDTTDFEIELPRVWFEGFARPFAHADPYIRIDALPAFARPFRFGDATWAFGSSHDGAGFGRLRVVQARPPDGDAPWSANGTVLESFAPAEHLQPLQAVEARLALPGRARSVRAAEDAVGAVWIVASSTTDASVYRARGGTIEPIAAAGSAPGAAVLPGPDPLVLLAAGVAGAGRTTRAAWTSRIDAPFPVDLADAFHAGVLPDGTQRFVRRRGAELDLLDLAPGRPSEATPSATATIPADHDPVGASVGPDGRTYVLWRSRSAVTTPGGTIGPGFAASVFDGALLSPPRLLREATDQTIRRSTTSYAAAAFRACPNPTLVLTCRTSSIDSDYAYQSDEVKQEILVLDPDLRPVTGPRTPLVLHERAGCLGHRLDLLRRSDGTVSLVTVAGCRPAPYASRSLG
jgi:hypothetical protein